MKLFDTQKTNKESGITNNTINDRDGEVNLDSVKEHLSSNFHDTESIMLEFAKVK